MITKDNQRLAEIHISEARKHALQLFAFTGSVFPSEWSSPWNEVITNSLIEFSFHARKVNELCDFRKDNFNNINNLIVSISSNNPGNWETDYHNALNAFMHIKSYVIGNVQVMHRIIFPRSSACLQSTYVIISTDRHAEKTISICGLVFCFLNEVIPKIKEKHQEIKF
ncbi:hypothetical protein [Aeromonas salmonicida]|uniref:hypothetical protein n=1 Tax=Aeromonas salmonicida TaxID=645 RepID=UPI0038BC2E7A